MIGTLLMVAVIAESIALIDALLVVLGHGLWLRWLRTRHRVAIARARTALAAALVETRPPADLLRLLQALAPRARTRLLVDAARNLQGPRRARITAIAHMLGLVPDAEAWCRSRLWWRRLYATRLLTALGGGAETVPPLLADPHPLVRAQAAEWAVDHPAPEVVEALLDLLDDAAGTVRFAAHASLLRMGDVVIEPLTRLLARPDGDRVEAALGVAAGLADPRLLPPILAACRSRLPRARALAATALGITGGHDGVAALTALLDDPAPTVRAAAAQALGRLGFWPAAQRLAPLLRDAAWSVRREAGLALRAFGAPGVLYLRRLLSDHDPFAVDMARHVLDLPDVIMHPGAPSP